MILVCSFCQARYLVSASLFAYGPRQVRCARCSHKWTADAEETALEDEKKALLGTTPPPESVSPVPVGSNLPALARNIWPSWLKRFFRTGLICLGLLLCLVVILDRQNIAKKWPSLESFYDIIGFHIYRPGEGLKIEHVRSELHYEDGITRLMISGTIVNPTRKTQLIPPLVAAAVGSGGDVMQSWQIDPPAATLDPEGEMPFSSTINTPKGTVVEINLNFVEARHEP